jgi:hypothetical protein
MTRLAHAWRGMAPEQRLAALASLALLVTMLFPWYGLQSLNSKREINSHSISAFGDVSFVEAAVFLVAVGVVVMVLARAEGREFHLPGGDGTIVTIAGGWAGLLIFYRVFARPAGHGYPVGIEWGFFLAFMAAGGLAYAGWRMRAAERPEPPLMSRRGMRRGPRADHDPGPGHDPGTRHDPDPRAEPGPRTDPVPPQADVRAEPDPPAARDPQSDEEVTMVAPAPGRSGRRTPVPARGQPTRERPPYPPAPPEQLSFEDPRPDSD